MRYTLLREAEEDIGTREELQDESMIELTEEEKERFEAIEAKERQFYDPEEKRFNYNKKRVTDLRENARVTLPKPASEIHEAGIEIRRNNLKRTVREFMEKECNGTKNQKPNLTKNEKDGLISLQKRIKVK